MDPNNKFLNKINSALFTESDISVYVKRDDLVHPIYGGNKFRKLKYNIEFIKSHGIKTILTFGGAFSNHIAATAYAGKLMGFKTIGIIRGDEFNGNQAKAIENNKTLREAQLNGMHFKFVSRDIYKRKYESTYWDELKNEFGELFILPEGGSNDLAIKGCADIVTAIDIDFDYIITPVGTGTTLLGIASALKPHQKVIGIEVYKNNHPAPENLEYLKHQNFKIDPTKICIKNYAFGGYGKSNDLLNNFCENFYNQYHIPVEPIYTGKMFYGLMDLIQKGFFEKGSKIIALHTGGLQYL